jgi:hypothetical protein
MSNRIHSRKINRIEYSVGIFNGQSASEIHSILTDFSNDVYVSEDENRMEMPKKDFQEGIDNFRSMGEEEFKEAYPVLASEYTKDQVADNLQYLLDVADPEQLEITLDWF